jgi:hypothetical protein
LTVTSRGQSARVAASISMVNVCWALSGSSKMTAVMKQTEYVTLKGRELRRSMASL